MKYRIIFLPFLIATLSQADEVKVDPVYQAMIDAEPDGRTFNAAETTLQRDVFSFQFDNGDFYCLPLVNGKEWAVLFRGEGSLSIATPSTLAEHFIRHIFKEDEPIQLKFKRMYLLFSDDTLTELLRGREPLAGDAGGADRTLKGFRQMQVKDFGRNFYFRILADLYNKTAEAPGAFIALIQEGTFNHALVIHDPLGIEASLPGNRMGNNHSLFQVLDEKDSGLWYLDRAQQGEDLAGEVQSPTDALHYRIHTIVERKKIVGETEITFKPLVANMRLLELQLMSRLALESAELFAEGSETAVACTIAQETQSGAWDTQGMLGSAVIAPQPLEAGKTYRLALRYQGDDVIFNDFPHVYFVAARTTWYPNLGTFTDRATYDLTFDYPKRTELFSVGKLVERKTEDKRKIDRWKSEVPITVAGFNYGEFLSYEGKDDLSGLELRILAFKDTNPEPSQAVLADVINSAKLYSTYFGALPFEKIRVTQQAAWAFGQAWPTLVFMPAFSFNPAEVQRYQAAGFKISEFVNQVGAHELAHQWWGHLVTAESLADQWIEEGFAEYSSILFLQHTVGWDACRKVLKTSAEDILTYNPSSRVKNYAVGPISFGYRLANGKTPAAYRLMIYNKGAYILHMLRMMMMDTRSQNPDEHFIAMMKDFTATHGGGSVTTDDFKAMVEKHILPKMNAKGDGKMDWFFDQWVHGMEIPAYRCDVAAEPQGDGFFQLQGSIAQEGVSDEFMAMVPIYAVFDGDRIIKMTDLPFKGSMSRDIDVKVRFPAAPKEIAVNANYDILAWP